MLHPARLREDLPELLLRDGDDRALSIKDDGAGAGGALVEGEDVFHARRHFRASCDVARETNGSVGLRAVPH